MATSKRFIVKNGIQTPNIEFLATGTTSTINLTMLDSDALSFTGNSGQLFSITDSQTGTIFAVNDISGVPSIEVDDDGEIRLAELFGNVGVGLSNPTYKFQVSGTTYLSTTTVGSGISILGTTSATSTTTGALIVAGGVGVQGNLYVGKDTYTRTLTVGTGKVNENNYLVLTNPGIGWGNGFSFIRGTDAAGINVIETASDSTMYEMWMSDNPDGGDMMQWRVSDWQSANGLVVPIQTTGLTNRFVSQSHTFYGPIAQSGNAFFTTSNFGGTNGSNTQQLFNAPNKLRIVGSTVDITALNVSRYTGVDGAHFWIKLDSTTTFAWGYGSPSGTATASGIALSTSEIPLSNGISVSFSATTGTLGDTFTCRVWKPVQNSLAGTTFTGDTRITSTTTSTSTTTGALTVAGGVGIQGNLYVGGEIVADKLTIQYTTVTTTLVQTDDIIQTLNSTSATNTASGALQVAGGVGVGGSIYAGGPIYANGVWTVLTGTGAIGYQGSQGILGYQGSQGAVGYQGSQGVIGYTGSQGSTGYTGSQGTTGYFGSTGYTGSTGSTGTQGAVGYQGSAGSGGLAIATPTTLGGVFAYTTSTGGNTSVGYCAGNTTMTGTDNIAIGCFALYVNTTGLQNIGIGNSALAFNSTGTGNVAVGYTALRCNTTGGCNVGVGFLALTNNVTGCANVAIGTRALQNNTTGVFNTAVGEQAGLSNTSGIDNTYIGRLSGATNSTSNRNTGVGVGTLQANTAAINTAVGFQALTANTTGCNNIGIGYQAGCSITTGVNNTVIGQLPAAAGCVCTVLIGAGTCERIRVDNSGLYVNNSAFTNGSTTVVDNTTTNATFYPMLSSVTSGLLTTATVSSSELTWNPGTGAFTILGSLYASTKSFRIPHPTKSDSWLTYGSLEGPENGVYIRGRSQTTVIDLPDYWTALVDENTITVDLTPVGKFQKLYVDRVENNQVFVSNDALFGSAVDYYYTVWAERKDVGKLQVEVRK